MSIELPKPVAAYFAAESAADASALARCFASDGVVHDEGGAFTGRAAIIPVELRHVFRLDGQEIASLEIG
jgi:hypothetical protein